MNLNNIFGTMTFIWLFCVRELFVKVLAQLPDELIIVWWSKIKVTVLSQNVFLAITPE